MGEVLFTDIGRIDHFLSREERKGFEEFQTATGISIWSASELGDIGEAVKFIRQAMGQRGFAWRIRNNVSLLKDMITQLEATADLFAEEESTPSPSTD